MLKNVKIIPHTKPCKKEQGNIILYTEWIPEEENPKGHQIYNMVFLLEDLDKFRSGAFDQFGENDRIKYLKQETYNSIWSKHSWSVKFAHLQAFWGVEKGMSYMMRDLAQDYNEIKADNVGQLTIDDIKSVCYSKIKNIEYYEDYRTDLFLRYINKYDQNW